MDQQNTNNKNMVLTVAGLVALGAAGVIYFKYFNAPTVTTQEVVGQQVVTNSTPTMTSKTSQYKNGKYMVVGDYVSPGGPEQIDVSLTLENGIVKEVMVTPKATLPGSLNFQQKFAEGISGVVVGKSLGELNVDKVSGSSLTPKGFNDAVEKIKSQALQS